MLIPQLNRMGGANKKLCHANHESANGSANVGVNLGIITLKNPSNTASDFGGGYLKSIFFGSFEVFTK